MFIEFKPRQHKALTNWYKKQIEPELRKLQELQREHKRPIDTKFLKKFYL